MTDRAKRAAAELLRRGWMMDLEDEELDRQCQQCGFQMRHDARFCQQCGTKVELTVASGGLEDLEAAIDAAMGQP